MSKYLDICERFLIDTDTLKGVSTTKVSSVCLRFEFLKVFHGHLKVFQHLKDFVLVTLDTKEILDVLEAKASVRRDALGVHTHRADDGDEFDHGCVNSRCSFHVTYVGGAPAFVHDEERGGGIESLHVQSSIACSTNICSSQVSESHPAQVVMRLPRVFTSVNREATASCLLVFRIACESFDCHGFVANGGTKVKRTFRKTKFIFLTLKG